MKPTTLFNAYISLHNEMNRAVEHPLSFIAGGYWRRRYRLKKTLEDKIRDHLLEYERMQREVAAIKAELKEWWDEIDPFTEDDFDPLEEAEWTWRAYDDKRPLR